MPDLLERVYESAMELTEEDRSLLALRLLKSFHVEEDERSLKDEIKRRQDEVLSGKVNCLPIQDVLQRMKDRRP